jgi:hypothetical protein
MPTITVSTSAAIKDFLLVMVVSFRMFRPSFESCADYTARREKGFFNDFAALLCKFIPSSRAELPAKTPKKKR